MSKILIVEDETRISSFLEKGLKANGFVVKTAGTGDSALLEAQIDKYDLMILDLGLPDMDGLSVLEEFRRRNKTVPVIILTARDGVQDTVSGLEGGADDYVTKPFRFEELLARVRARLRSESSSQPAVLHAGDASLDLKTRRLLINEKSIELSAREFALAEVFFRNPEQVLSREQLLSSVWGYDYDPGSNIVDVYVGYLRRKLGEGRIATVRGMGYRLKTSA